MTERIFHSTTVVLPSGPAREAWVVLHGDRIASVVEGAAPAEPGDAPVEELGDRLLAPGFVDQHVHGGGGGAFSDGPEGAAAALSAHRRAGTTTSASSRSVLITCVRDRSHPSSAQARLADDTVGSTRTRLRPTALTIVDPTPWNIGSPLASTCTGE